MSADVNATILEMTAQRKSLQEIATACGISPRRVSYRKRDLGISGPGAVPYTDEEREFARASSAEGMPSNWIAETLDRSPYRLRKLFPMSEQAIAEWKVTWQHILKNADLLALHREFSPPPTHGWGTMRPGPSEPEQQPSRS